MIDELATLTPDAARAARVVAKCHARLKPQPRRRLSLEPVLLAGISVVYLAAVALSALAVWMG
jgi:hypothetical protein